MLIKDLISQLQLLYNTYTPDMIEVMGEPEIMIDVFHNTGNHLFTYKGFSGNIMLDKTGDGVYDIIVSTETEFNENPKTQATKSFSQPWPFPQGG